MFHSNGPLRKDERQQQLHSCCIPVVRYQREEPRFRQLSIKFLTKTGANMARQISDGETMAVYLMHGRPVKTDDFSEVYSNTDFAPSFEATDRMRELLAEMLAQ